MSRDDNIIATVEKDFVTDVDGFIYWWPNGSQGHWPAHALREIADELDKRNAPWDAIIHNDPAISGGALEQFDEFE